MASGPWPILLTVRMLDQGGCERDLARVALNIDRSRFEPHVGCFFRTGVRLPDLTNAGIPVAEFPLRGLKSPNSVYQTLRSFRAYTRAHNIRLLHTYDGPTAMFLIPLARLAGIPVLLSSQLSLRELNSNREQGFLRLSDRLVSRIVVNSKAVLDDLVSNFGIPKNKLVLVYNGVDTLIFRSGEKFRPHGIDDAPLVIGSIAALREEKQLHLLIEAFAAARGVRPGVKLLIVGGGYDEQRLRRTAADLNVEDGIVWIPAQTNVAEWMRAIDIFVLPSRSESFPNGLLEAMASGCCPVGSRVGGIPELIEDGKSGLVFPSGNAVALADCLRSLLTDDALRLRLAQAAYERAHSLFTLEKFVANTSRLYTTLLSEYYGASAAPLTVHT
jgi:glycosyltransferase involved in cell wall biosynthesis